MSATTEKPAGADERPRLLPRESIAKNLILGEIVEENLFPYPAIRSRDREMLGQIVEAIDDFSPTRRPISAAGTAKARSPPSSSSRCASSGSSA